VRSRAHLGARRVNLSAFAFNTTISISLTRRRYRLHINARATMTLIPPNATRRANDHNHSHTHNHARAFNASDIVRDVAQRRRFGLDGYEEQIKASFFASTPRGGRGRTTSRIAGSAPSAGHVDARAFERARAFGLAVPHAAVKKSSTYARADEAESYRSLWLSDRARWLEAQKRRWVRLRVKIREARNERERGRERVPERKVISTSEASSIPRAAIGEASM